MQKKKINGFALAGMIIGICSILLVCFSIGFFTGLLGLGFSIVALCQKNKSYGMSITGIITSSLAILLSFFVMLIGFILDLNESATESTKKTQNNYLKETEKEIVSPSSEIAEVEVKEDVIDCTISKCNVKYLKHELITNQSGENCIVVYYEFKNNSDEKQTFSYVVYDMAFQNGIELEDSFWLVEDAEDNDYLEIKPGVTIIVYSSFVLRDNSPVEVEVEQWSAWDDKVYDSMVIEIE